MAERRPPPAPPGTADTPAERWQHAHSHREMHEHDPRRAPELDAQRRRQFLHTRDGVFYPTGHAVLVMERDDAQHLVDALGQAGFPGDAMMLLDSAQTADLMRASEEQAGLLAEIVGAEIKNLRVIRQLADGGAWMLVVRVKDDDEEQRLLQASGRWPIHKAMRYHRLAIEELPVGSEDIPGDSPYGVNEVLRNKPSDARMKPRR